MTKISNELLQPNSTART